MRDFAKYALEIISDLSVDYADIRLRETKIERIFTYNDVLKNVVDRTEIGIGIRILKNGRWGFAATPYLDKKNIEKTIIKALKIANSTGDIKQRNIKLSNDTPLLKGSFKTKIEIDPFSVSLNDKADILFQIYKNVKKVKNIKKVNSMMFFKKMHQFFLSTEGADIENEIFLSAASYTITAVGNYDFQTRMYQEFPKNKGYEWILSQPLLEKSEEIAHQANEKLYAKDPPYGKKDLILLPPHLALTIHESVGHPTELDRVLGWEANYAGTSFATIDKKGIFKYGSDIVNIQADNTIEGGLASWGFDDDGIPSKKWDIIKNGILVNYGTTRETAEYIGENESKGCNRADSYCSQPINRIPNLSLLYSDSNLTLDELINDTKDGILIDGRGSFSIDQRRYNFQFGGDKFYEIKNGKISGEFKNVTYQSISPEFWNSCDAICGKDSWELWGILNCGKGEPMQSMQMSHGSSPARFRNITVGGAFKNE